MHGEPAPGPGDPPGNLLDDPPAAVPVVATSTAHVPPALGLARAATDGRRPAPLDATPVRHPARWAAMAVITVLTAMFVHTLVTNPRFGWSVVADYFTARTTLDGLWVTVELTIVSMAVGIGLGTVLAIMRLSPNPLVSSTSWFYIWIFRGTPVIVQILFWNFIGALFPTLSFGIPFGPSFIQGSANDVVTPFIAALLGLGLNEAAYMAEIVRAGIVSVDHGQTEASLSLGLSRMQTMRLVVLPQAMRMIVPPTGNEVISMLKTSSLASVIAVTELLYSVQIVYSRTFQQIPMLLVAVIWYLIVTTVLNVGQYYVERHFSRGSAGSTPTARERLRRGLLPTHADPFRFRPPEPGLPDNPNHR
jgi:polar amino acid transport system permease protein